ncbi:Site-specific DNA recombinase [Rhodovulum sp. ES.010]|uniref:recombinase family protein n=1 Tax=Rhodovulum sp. ES.010 TaxID=1882821 RepID=UPI000929C1A0|nr:recombinase family protein [Rhodovulum sp. ES.010]SIN99170.1 Site-specific DNA recombinase [Rhodovulum sp. ES.010]
MMKTDVIGTVPRMRAAIYARYSTDLQSPASIADQVRTCRRLCEERGWEVVEVFDDMAISGATRLRPQFQQMQEAARKGQFDVLVAEALDRLSRDQEHIAGLHKRMRFNGVAIFTKAEGEISELHIGLGGTMSALFLRQLAQKTHRGLEGRVKAGKSAGGISYGYRLNRQPLPDGSFTTGDRVVDETEAEIVRRIFREYDQGKSARTIAVGLNRDGIAPPRAGGKGSGAWSFSTISGNWKRGTGILNNELYVGKLVWNRQNFIKDPETGKRQARLNPPEAWIIEEVPHLRIIDDALWDRVKERQSAIRKTMKTSNQPRNAFGAARRPTYLFSGLLKCGDCGAAYTLMNGKKYGCSGARNRGTCANRALISRTAVERRVLEGLKHELMHPDLVREFVEAFRKEMRRERRATQATREAQKRRHGQVLTEIDAIVSAITQGMFHPSMKAKMDALEAERAELEEKLAALPETEPVTLHPRLSDIYSRKVMDLTKALNDPEARAEAADLLRGLVSEIRLIPDPDAEDGHAIELFGDLGSILAFSRDGNAKPRRFTGGVSDSLVAGVGFEPTTFRL